MKWLHRFRHTQYNTSTHMHTFSQTLRTASGDAGDVNVYFHIHGKGNENSTSLKYGQAVNYSQGLHAKGICAENIVAIAGV